MTEVSTTARHPLNILAGSISVSYRQRLGWSELAEILRAGQCDDRWAGHVATLIEESPLQMLAAAVASFSADQQPQVLDGLQALARAIGSDRIERWMTG